LQFEKQLHCRRRDSLTPAFAAWYTHPFSSSIKFSRLRLGFHTLVFCTYS
jgi:hypothetical protein